MMARTCKRTMGVIAAALTIACGGPEGTTATATETTGTGVTTGTTGSPTSTDGTAPTSAGSTAADVTAADATTESTITQGGSTADLTGTMEPPVTTTPDTGDTGDTGTSDTGAEVVPCVSDDECVLIDDCCSCEPIGPGEAPPQCDLPECFVTQCAPSGLEGAKVECRFGRCMFARVACHPALVVCDQAPPGCGPGDVASVDVEAGCWTGRCVPAEACDWVPDCTFCEEEELVCVDKLQKGPFFVCEARPTECGGADDIDCGCGAQICEQSPPHTVCHDVNGDIACECELC